MFGGLDYAPRAWSGDLDGLGDLEGSRGSRVSRDFGNNAPIIYKKIYAKNYKKNGRRGAEGPVFVEKF